MKNLILIYNKKERWGILSLAMLNLVFLLMSYSYTRPVLQYSEEEVLAFQYLTMKSQKKSFIEVVPKDSLFVFNPNNVTKTELIQLGFSKRVIKNMLNYRAKGGRFYQEQDLLKIYGMDSLFFLKVKDYCDFPNKKNYKKPSFKSVSKNKKSVEKFIFDPNSATKKQLEKLGFPYKSIKAILNYRKKGGRFYQPESLKKIYGITDKFYALVAPFIQVKKAQFAKHKNSDTKRSYSKTSSFVPSNNQRTKFIVNQIEINSATKEDWEQLPGIGTFYAKNIIQLRDKLGGFHAINQIKESYRFPDSTFVKIQEYLTVKMNNIQKIDLQRSSFKEINKHPYISYEQTKLLMKAQDSGLLYEIKDLQKTKIFNLVELEKLIPYLDFPEADYDE